MINFTSPQGNAGNNGSTTWVLYWIKTNGLFKKIMLCSRWLECMAIDGLL